MGRILVVDDSYAELQLIQAALNVGHDLNVRHLQHPWLGYRCHWDSRRCRAFRRSAARARLLRRYPRPLWNARHRVPWHLMHRHRRKRIRREIRLRLSAEQPDFKQQAADENRGAAQHDHAARRWYGGR